jgi:hypothetical protein
MKNFQSESKKSGDEFEHLVEQDLISRNGFIVGKDYCVKELGIELDYIADLPHRTEYVEAKGGNPGGKKRPGAQRTDNVKKAVCNGALLKHINKSAYYVIYFSAPPKPNSYSDNMIKSALTAGYVDEVRYL